MSLRSPGSRIPPSPSQKPTGPPVELDPPSDVLALVVVVLLSLTAAVVPVLPPLVLASLVDVPVPPLEPLAEPVLTPVAPVLPPSDVVGTPWVASLVPVDELTPNPVFVPAPESPHPTAAASTTHQPHRNAIAMPQSTPS